MAACLLAAGLLTGVDVVVDGEGTGASAVPGPSGAGVEVRADAVYASQGAHAWRLSFPAWSDGRPHKPAVALTPARQDWRGFERISFDLVNPGETDVRVWCRVLDGRRKEVKSFELVVPMLSAHRVVKKLSFAKEVDPAVITELQVHTDRSAAPFVIHLDHVALWRKGEEAGADPGPVVMRAIQKACRAAVAVHVEAVRAALPGIAAPFRPQVAAEAARLAAAAWPDDQTGDQRQRLVWDAQHLRESLARFTRLVELGRDPAAQGAGMVVGFATSMERVLPRHRVPSITAATGWTMSAARNEREAFQVAVAPMERDLRAVAVTVSDCRDAQGRVLPRTRIDCDLVAFTETKRRPAYAVDYVGWWPDPLIPRPRPVDVRLGEVQTWWIRVRVPENQAPGLYRGTITIAVAGVAAAERSLTVEVLPFRLPRHAPSAAIIGTMPNKWKDLIDRPAIGGRERWKTLKFAWADLLADYHITLDALYRTHKPDETSSLDVEVLQHLNKQGRLGPFCLGYFYAGGADHLEKFRANYDTVKRLGLLDHAYLYGFDEAPSWDIPFIEQACAGFRTRYPEVLTITTTDDGSNGNNPKLPSIGAVCPLINGYNVGTAAKARKELGKRVWWYTCCWPPHPYANFFIEYPPLDARALMGVQTAHFRPDGFLYYATAMFNDNAGIDAYPYTTWDPLSYQDFHGDGRWLYMDAAGQPIPSMVLEGYRDGLDDLAYHMILECQYDRHLRSARRDEAWLAQAKQALTDLKPYVWGLGSYTREPARLYEWRDRLARAIAASPEKDADPWQGLTGMPVRGVPRPVIR
jgi:hypothetical protein